MAVPLVPPENAPAGRETPRTRRFARSRPEADAPGAPGTTPASRAADAPAETSAPPVPRTAPARPLVPAVVPTPTRHRGLAKTARRGMRVVLLAAARRNRFAARGPLHPYHRLGREATNLEFVRVAATELMAREIAERGLPGAVAELGVHRGGFARTLNRVFAARTLYLFDTFSGFDGRDVASDSAAGLPATPYAVPPSSADVVRSLLPHPEHARIRAGWFPDTAAGLEHERFCFVHIDVGLRNATAAGLRWFHPRLVPGGYLVVADYNNAHAPGVRLAVREFVTETRCAYAVLPDFAGSAVLVKGA